MAGVVHAWVWQSAKSLLSFLALMYTIKQLLDYWRGSYSGLELHANYTTSPNMHCGLFQMLHFVHILSITWMLLPPKVYQVCSISKSQVVWPGNRCGIYVYGMSGSGCRKYIMFAVLLALLYATTFLDPTFWNDESVSSATTISVQTEKTKW